MSSPDEASSSSSPVPPDDDTAQKARAAAEARRQKILQQADARMGLVEGTYSSKHVAETASAATTETSTDNDNDEAAGAVDGSATTAGASGPTKAQRLAAMRRRRFKGKSGATAVTAPAVVADSGAAGVTVTNEATASKKDASAAIPTTITSTSTTTTSTDPEPLTSTSDSAAAATTTTPTATTTEEACLLQEEPVVEAGVLDTAVPAASEKQKYMGVAKMRRRMVKERQQQKQQQTEATSSTNTAATTTAAKSTSNTAKRNISFTQSWPILMHAVTVLLLFAVGLDVGWQQTMVPYASQYDAGAELPTIHSQLAPRQQGGLRLLNDFSWDSVWGNDKGAQKDVKPLGVQADPSITMHDNDEDLDEFSESGNNRNSGNAGTLDPLFGLHLDLYTRGPGVTMWLARRAVALHRINLSIFYYGPLVFFEWLVSSLTSFPPILCLAAILVRQVIGKVVLGARLPSAADGDDGNNAKDVLGMAKSFVTGFMLKSFPNAAAIYDAWTHLRSDMYVILCGLFVGLAAAHHHAAGSPYGSDDTETVVVTGSGGGGSDEL